MHFLWGIVLIVLHELAEQIISGEIETVEIQHQLKNMAANVESSVANIDEGKPETEPFWE